MLLPILFFLLYQVILGFRTNHEASDHAIQQHAELLLQFNHGNNPNPIVIDGVKLVPGRLIDLVPPVAGLGIGDFLKSFGPKALESIGLNMVLSRIPTNTYAEGFAKGAFKSAGNSYISTGGVDSTTTALGGLAGALATNEANEDFHRVSSIYGPASQEQIRADFWGGSLQNGLIAGANSKGDWKNMAAGAVGSMVNSPLAGEWFHGLPNDALAGAAKGAIMGTVAGVFGGGLNFKNVGISTAMGGFNSTTVAEMFTTKEGQAAMSSVGYIAARASFATLLEGGNVKEAASAAVAGAAIGMARGLMPDVYKRTSGPIENVVQGSSPEEVDKNLESAGNNTQSVDSISKKISSEVLQI